jgi:hypothetical protein
MMFKRSREGQFVMRDFESRPADEARVESFKFDISRAYEQHIEARAFRPGGYAFVRSYKRVLIDRTNRAFRIALSDVKHFFIFQMIATAGSVIFDCV